MRKYAKMKNSELYTHPLPARERRKCAHVWSCHGISAKEDHVICVKCGERTSIALTGAECKQRLKKFDREERMIDRLNEAYHAFMKKFKKYSRDGTVTWRWTGYQLMEKVREWVEEGTFGPQIAYMRCDDDANCSSDLLIIRHRNYKEYWGTTVVFLLQHTDPTVFFLYPHHLDALVRELTAIQRLEKRMKCRRSLKRRPKKN